MLTASKFDIRTLKCGHQVYSPNYCGELTVVRLGYGKVPAEDVVSGRAKPCVAYLSADGHGFLEAWDCGAMAGEMVYVEIHDYSGCSFHGYVDSDSRKIVQAG